MADATDKPKPPPGYDVDMEVLATLPKAPAGCKLTHLRTTVGLVRSRQVNASLGRLRTHGYYIDLWRPVSSGGVRASIQTKSWTAATAAAEAYWDKVYGDEQT